MTVKRTVFLILIALLVTGCAGDFKKMRQYSRPMVKLGMEKLANNDLQGALLDFKKAEAANPRDPEVYYGLALTYRQWDKLQFALENVDKAIDYGDKLGFEHPGMMSEAYNLKGDILSSQKRYDEAIDCFKKSLKDDLYTQPEYGLYNLGLIYLQQGQLPEAQGYVDQALLKNPHYAPAWFLKAAIENKKGQTKDAIKALHHAVEEYPDYTEAHWELAMLCLKNGDQPTAVTHLHEVVRLDKDGNLGKQAQRSLNDLGIYEE